jgi:hypothetical protein
MAAGAESVSLLTLVMSSAVVSALVNVGWNGYAKWLDRKKEVEKEAQRVGHVYLALVLQLESFARRCNEQLYDIEEAMERYSSQHDTSAFENLPRIEFAFDPEPDWTLLPVPFVAKVQSLVNRFNQAHTWISSQFQYWADLDDAYQFEQERLACYGHEACRVAAEIRVQIKAGEGDLSDLLNHFGFIVEKRRKWFLQTDQKHNLLPELRARFENEYLALAASQEAE